MTGAISDDSTDHLPRYRRPLPRRSAASPSPTTAPPDYRPGERATAALDSTVSNGHDDDGHRTVDAAIASALPKSGQRSDSQRRPLDGTARPRAPPATLIRQVLSTT